MDVSENVIALATHRKVVPTPAQEEILAHDQALQLRPAKAEDVAGIQRLYHDVYEGNYPHEYASNPETLQAEIQDQSANLWLVAESLATGLLAGVIVFRTDRTNRLAKAAGVVVDAHFRECGVGTALLKRGVSLLTEGTGPIEVIYATTRTINEAPSRVVHEVGFRQMGLFPNAVQVESFEHLNLDVYLTPTALENRRKGPFVIPAFQEFYNIARKQLGLEHAHSVTERAPLTLASQKIRFRILDNEQEAILRFEKLSAEKRVSNSFFPFHRPNRVLVTEDGGTEVFVHFGGVAMQSAIVGYRTDRANIHDLFDSVAHCLQRAGAAYVELLVDAYNYMLQQEAFTARFIPSAYFPAMKLNHDGLRDDYFVLSRTFRLLDFSGSVVSGESRKYLKVYLRFYNDLYIKPILG